MDAHLLTTVVHIVLALNISEAWQHAYPLISNRHALHQHLALLFREFWDIIQVFWVQLQELPHLIRFFHLQIRVRLVVVRRFFLLIKLFNSLDQVVEDFIVIVTVHAFEQLLFDAFSPSKLRFIVVIMSFLDWTRSLLSRERVFFRYIFRTVFWSLADDDLFWLIVHVLRRTEVGDVLFNEVRL